MMRLSSATFLWIAVSIAAAAAVLSGCPGSSSPSGLVRTVNLTAGGGAAPIDVFVEASLIVDDLAVDGQTGYSRVAVGDFEFSFTRAGQSTQSAFDSFMLGVDRNVFYTLLVLGSDASPGTQEVLALADGGALPQPGNSRIRVVQGDLGLGRADIYVTPDGTPLGSTPSRPGLNTMESTGYFEIPGGPLRVSFVFPNGIDPANPQATIVESDLIGDFSDDVRTVILHQNALGAAEIRVLEDGG